ncbi:glycoside hydrolase family 3 C-terminal domain-containing protein [Kineosporia sp. J2-2]|uniref:Glycoside hydrolase family 3 C-terminal domain-containing protein n=1 Tax=Kineosporia corallincola TaxID=2835133 RepID=A0ABS5TNS6_9ACTN|nr:glycoside hydrolase family 3 C-terminal domain-containing protein [Kineosporia corallincola]MBT0772034.1 glycoside hydrolase family 3 C-terminal domain-containing protein [Kineosporia corallincola]
MTHPLISQLTLEEKASLVSGASFWTTRSVDRVGIPAATLTDGPHGVRMQAGESDHLGLNASHPATAFPTAAALGSTWDPELVEEVGQALGAESRALDVDVLLGPGVNIKRSPLCGRNFEYFSEDPLLAGALGTAWVKGVQSQGVGASLKHYAANNQETDRMRVSAEVDERSLREIYFPAFERTVTQAQPATVMCSYNKINGTYASQNHWLLTDVLRGDWGFTGYVVSDWGAVVDPVAAVAAGLDLEMPSSGDRGPAAIVAAVKAGTLDETLLDQAAERVVSVHERLRAARGEQAPKSVAELTDAHHALARRTAAAGSVLLKNDGGLLPLDPAEGGRIAVVGEFARTPRYQGAGSSHINPTKLDDALSAIRATTTRAVSFEPGFTFDGSNEEALREAAVKAASEADVVVAFLGLPDAEESEGFDRSHLDLAPVQTRLLTALLAANQRVVVVLSNGAVVSADGITDAAAVLEMWLGGQASGLAAADILFGAAEPEGRLAETLPLRLADTPAFVNWPGSDRKVVYGERVYVGYRWYDTIGRDVAFPFGFGLGYTTFEFSDVAVTVADPKVAAAVVEVTVTNTGDRAGAEVVQVYVADPVAGVDRPAHELRAFSKVRLAAGESRRVRLELDERAFAYWAPTGWLAEPGEYLIEVGASSRDIRHTTSITLDLPAVVPVLDEQSTYGEFSQHPQGAKVLEGFVTGLGAAGAMFSDPAMTAMIDDIPMRNVISFGGVSDVEGTLAVLLKDAAQG